jgi:2,4-dienoyl-CoA reductase-like NADH-dependent reductase (Old Yellow Enzyme family)
VIDPVAPSRIPTFGRTPRELNRREITAVQKQFAAAARRVKVVRSSKKPGYMVPLAQAVKKHVSVPVIAAGRISKPKLAESILDKGRADLIGLARVLWTDPFWVKKARQGRAGDIVKCSPRCNACMELVMKGRPAFCTRWDRKTRGEHQALFA